jgi:hypothetical protein
MSFLTAAFAMVGGLLMLIFERSFSGLLWMAFGLCWLTAAIVQRLRNDPAEPQAGRRLFRRFTRLLIFS